jgi:hypothetical protein
MNVEPQPCPEWGELIPEPLPDTIRVDAARDGGLVLQVGMDIEVLNWRQVHSLFVALFTAMPGWSWVTHPSDPGVFRLVPPADAPHQGAALKQ